MADPIQTPECDRMIAARTETEPAGEFFAWLRDTKGYVLASWSRRPVGHDDKLVPVFDSVEKLLAEWQGINLDEVERERRLVLAQMGQETKG